MRPGRSWECSAAAGRPPQAAAGWAAAGLQLATTDWAADASPAVADLLEFVASHTLAAPNAAGWGLAGPPLAAVGPPLAAKHSGVADWAAAGSAAGFQLAPGAAAPAPAQPQALPAPAAPQEGRLHAPHARRGASFWIHGAAQARVCGI